RPAPSRLVPYTTLFRSSIDEDSACLSMVFSSRRRTLTSTAQFVLTRETKTAKGCASQPMLVMLFFFASTSVVPVPQNGSKRVARSEEHTSELQSLAYLV